MARLRHGSSMRSTSAPTAAPAPPSTGICCRAGWPGRGFSPVASARKTSPGRYGDCGPGGWTYRAVWNRRKASRTRKKSRRLFQESGMQMVDLPDNRGHFGPYGGVFVAETLVHALEELRTAYEACRKDPAFIAEFEYELKHYVGRPSPVYHAKRLSGLLGGAQIYLKREADRK